MNQPTTKRGAAYWMINMQPHEGQINILMVGKEVLNNECVTQKILSINSEF
jgi:hypothetical protein